MKYIVTGGAGFIGSNLVDLLIDEGHEIDVIDNFSSGKKENCNEKAKYHNIDISDQSNYDELKKILANADMNVKRLVYSASSSAYGNTINLPSKEEDPIDPISPYAMQKYYGEVACRMFANVYGIETVSLRYFNVYGERQSLEGAYALVMCVFARQRLNNEPMTIRGDGEQRRDFTHVKDIAKANLLAMTSEKVGAGEVINIGNSDNRSVNQIAAMIGGPTVTVDPVVEPRETLANNSKAKNLLGWSPSVIIEEWVPKYKKDLGI